MAMDGINRIGFAQTAKDGLTNDCNKGDCKTMKLYHCTTPKKAKAYKASGCIYSPVRGFTTLNAAMAWCVKTGRTVVYEFDADTPYKLPDHHNKFGEAWWNDGDIPYEKIVCVFSAEKDA